MPPSPSTRDDTVRSFWDRYIKSLHESGVRPPFDRWHVLRAEHYIAAHPGRRLADHTPAEVDAYLTEMGRNGGLKGWQFRQIVDAIQKLVELAGAGWTGEVDWEHWRASAQALGREHPSVARDYEDGPPGPVTAAPDTTLKQVRENHAALLDRVRATIRLRGHAIKTEQSYLHWIARYVAFLDNADPSAQGAAEVAGFLEYLALRRKVSASTQNLALNALVFLYRETLRTLGDRPRFYF